MSSTQPIDLRRDRTPLARASPLIVAATDFTPAGLAAVSGLDPAALTARLRVLVRSDLLVEELDPRSPERGQYHSSEILAWLEKRQQQRTWRLLALTAVDLYIPILTFVFGEARLGPGLPILLGSYHPSRQNTNTGKLTPPMMRSVFMRARALLDSPP